MGIFPTLQVYFNPREKISSEDALVLSGYLTQLHRSFYSNFVSDFGFRFSGMGVTYTQSGGDLVTVTVNPGLAFIRFPSTSLASNTDDPNGYSGALFTNAATPISVDTPGATSRWDSIYMVYSEVVGDSTAPGGTETRQIIDPSGTPISNVLSNTRTWGTFTFEYAPGTGENPTPPAGRLLYLNFEVPPAGSGIPTNDHELPYIWTADTWPTAHPNTAEQCGSIYDCLASIRSQLKDIIDLNSWNAYVPKSIDGFTLLPNIIWAGTDSSDLTSRVELSVADPAAYKELSNLGTVLLFVPKTNKQGTVQLYVNGSFWGELRDFASLGTLPYGELQAGCLSQAVRVSRFEPTSFYHLCRYSSTSPDLFYAPLDTGSANNLKFSVDRYPALSTFAPNTIKPGSQLMFNPGFANTGVPGVSINGNANLTILTPGGSNFSGGEISPGTLYSSAWDGGGYRILGTEGKAKYFSNSCTVYTPGPINGWQLTGGKTYSHFARGCYAVVDILGAGAGGFTQYYNAQIGVEGNAVVDTAQVEGGGGGGAFCRFLVQTIPGQSYSVSVGRGGRSGWAYLIGRPQNPGWNKQFGEDGYPSSFGTLSVSGGRCAIGNGVSGGVGGVSPYTQSSPFQYTYLPDSSPSGLFGTAVLLAWSNGEAAPSAGSSYDFSRWGRCLPSAYIPAEPTTQYVPGTGPSDIRTVPEGTPTYGCGGFGSTTPPTLPPSPFTSWQYFSFGSNGYPGLVVVYDNISILPL
jgi:hypothetical protein